MQPRKVARKRAGMDGPGGASFNRMAGYERLGYPATGAFIGEEGCGGVWGNAEGCGLEVEAKRCGMEGSDMEL